MARITYVEFSGTEHTLSLPNGVTLMEGAINNMVPGIEGDCGGLCACATCHCYISEDWQKKCEAPEELESAMLDFAFDVNDESRLACQIKVSDELDGIRVKLPKKQY
ncbi:MAG: 2Fe-2S iron-sulfur cluster binding domain-containing protein [Pseudomonadales bacterium]|nr:2Fe-2S iron-sulfur cluster binding domain-containing protein [Pseudomonadales bacterium]